MRKILLVDDEDGIRTLWTRLHDTMDETFRGQCEMETAADLERAKYKLAHSTYDAVILDLSMPPEGRDGIISWLYSAAPALPPVVVLTGSDDIFVRRRCMMAGAANFITKNDAVAFPNLFFKMLYNEYLRRIYETEKHGT